MLPPWPQKSCHVDARGEQFPGFSDSLQIVDNRTQCATPIPCGEPRSLFVSGQLDLCVYELLQCEDRFSLDLGNFSIAGPTALEALTWRRGENRKR